MKIIVKTTFCYEITLTTLKLGNFHLTPAELSSSLHFTNIYSSLFSLFFQNNLKLHTFLKQFVYKIINK